MNADETFNAERAFVRACPSFRSQIEEMRREWVEGEPSLFNIFNQLGYHLADVVEHGGTAELKSALQVVEETFRAGTDVEVHATTFGFLTSLQIGLKQRGMNPESLVEHLGPSTYAWWNDLNQNREGGYDW